MSADRRRFLIDILIEDPKWTEKLNEEAWEEFFASVLEKVFHHLHIQTETELSILLTDSNKMKELNNNFRHKDKPTNVLSFPSDEFDEDEGGFLGDLAFGFEVIQSEKDDFMSHMTHLTIHGILHLLGFDHENDQDAEEMENLEIDILKLFNIQNPYQEI